MLKSVGLNRKGLRKTQLLNENCMHTYMSMYLLESLNKLILQIKLSMSDI